ncbi:MAG: nagB [Microbacterium sp.]|uniref:glucosamine-6-phosphate deaminase n=1 Tax=Microbacterium sp. AG238 TaxID=2183994 RepID=UPI000E7395F4|nr:glucosamine-6-phosphate deaminase [Microbacterium sp. AG238]MDF2580539.1 nagB [Microbacterium sp.]RKE64126.1 glucosamine-6-phosphate deaminase [Microbacterium sp. AG238]
MRIIVSPDPVATGASAAHAVASAADHRPDLVLGVATGSSPQPLYRSLAILVRAGLDLSSATAFALDEYAGLAPEHPQSYHSVIARDVTAPLRLDPDSVHVPDGAAADADAAAEAYERAITRAGGVDLQILGIGTNGHIGFNEPGSPADSRTRIVDLTARTIADNSRFFPDPAEPVPTRALTQGVGTILAARRIVLVATGEHKAEAVARAVAGPVTAAVPASFLQRHPDVTFFLDETAASRLSPTVRVQPVNA